MSSLTALPQPTTLLHGIQWDTYERLVAEVESPIRITYDCGRMEIVSPKWRHEIWKRLVDKLIQHLVLELGVLMRTGGSPTLKRRDLQRGMEPDECYWIQNEAAVRGKMDLDLEVDPVPDLVFEAEATRSLLDRLPILASLGVGEVWRYDGTRLIVHLLDESGTYVESPTSRCFPWLPLDAFIAHLDKYAEMSENAWILQFQQWVRDTIDIDKPLA